MPRTFSGSVAVDYLQFSAGALADFKYGTVAAIVRRNAPSTWDCIWSTSTSASAGVFALEFSNAVSGLLTWYDGTASNNNNAPTVATADGWTFVAATKASGTATPVWYKQALSATSMTTTTAGCNSTDASSVGSSGFSQIGRWETTDWMNGDIAVVGVWSNSVLSAAQIGQLPYALTAWSSLGPSALWVLDQDTVAQSVPDLSGNGANQRARSNTTVASSVTLPIFSYGAPVTMASPSSSGGGATQALTASVSAISSFTATAMNSTRGVSATVDGVSTVTAGLAAEFSLAADITAVSSFSATGIQTVLSLSPNEITAVSSFSATGMVSTLALAAAFDAVSSFTATTLAGLGLDLTPVSDPGGLSLTPYSDPGGLSLTPYSDPGGLTLTPVT